MKSKNIIIFVEGETERHLLNNMKIEGMARYSKILKVNFWQDDIVKIIPFLSDTKAIILIIFDTDCIEVKTEKRFKNNLKNLEKRGYRFHLLQQTKNFEDELIYSCCITHGKLISHFCGEYLSKSEFKSKFLSCGNPVSKLKKINFSGKRLWARNLINELNDFSKYKGSYNKLFIKE